MRWVCLCCLYAHFMSAWASAQALQRMARQARLPCSSVWGEPCGSSGASPVAPDVAGLQRLAVLKARVVDQRPEAKDPVAAGSCHCTGTIGCGEGRKAAAARSGGGCS